MIKVTQSRVGNDGNCLAACLASILERPLKSIPETLARSEDQGKATNDFLSTVGLSYRRIPIDSTKPDGYSTIEGISPRGGMHACVAYNGKLVHDPHPQDGTGRGLVEPRYYGLLEPIQEKVGEPYDHPVRFHLLHSRRYERGVAARQPHRLAWRSG